MNYIDTEKLDRICSRGLMFEYVKIIIEMQGVNTSEFNVDVQCFLRKGLSLRRMTTTFGLPYWDLPFPDSEIHLFTNRKIDIF